MGIVNDSSKHSNIEPYSSSQRHAEITVQTALLVCEAGSASVAQIGDLADAVDALRDRQYRVAVILAEAAIEGRNRVRTAQRPDGMVRTLAEIRCALMKIQAQNSTN
jgi:hypothetical protein